MASSGRGTRYPNIFHLHSGPGGRARMFRPICQNRCQITFILLAAARRKADRREITGRKSPTGSVQATHVDGPGPARLDDEHGAAAGQRLRGPRDVALRAAADGNQHLTGAGRAAGGDREDADAAPRACRPRSPALTPLQRPPAAHRRLSSLSPGARGAGPGVRPGPVPAIRCVRMAAGGIEAGHGQGKEADTGRRPGTAGHAPGWPCPVATWKKFGDDQAGNLAALIAYYAFASIFPLLLVLVTVLDIVLKNDAALRSQVLHSALSQYPVIGTQLTTNVHGLHKTGLALAIGLILTFFGARGVANAMQNALNSVWEVPMCAAPRLPVGHPAQPRPDPRHRPRHHRHHRAVQHRRRDRPHRRGVRPHRGHRRVAGAQRRPVLGGLPAGHGEGGPVPRPAAQRHPGRGRVADPAARSAATSSATSWPATRPTGRSRSCSACSPGSTCRPSSPCTWWS